MEKKEVLRAILWFAAAAVIMTLVGNSVCPKIGTAAASLYSSLYAAESSNTAQTAEPEKPRVSESSEQVISTSTTSTTTTIPAVTVDSPPPAEPEPQSAVTPETGDSGSITQENVKQPEAVSESEKSQEKSPIPQPSESATEAAPQPSVQPPPASSADSPAPAEVPKESPPEKQVENPLSPDEIAALEKSMKEGEVREVGEGLAAYKVKKGDTFSQICKKVFGTSALWKEKAEKSNIDPAKIRPGKVLIFKKE
ncbi:MAG: hypothetical protein BWK80_15995 [Desulfobacteraceae bacterium IS3]|nr:MAG: hypothetical protein BWK80_15995 [Desulfobacteraceae bacterium IS3]